jgi:hypothetical protein
MKLFLLINALLFAGALDAQTVYKWVDENGDVHYSQTLPPERAQDAHDRLTADGLLAERVERVRTDQEREAIEQERARQREAAEQARLEAQQDRLFLAAFPTEADIKRAIESRRDNVQAERRSVLSLLEQARGRFASAVREAAEYERSGKQVPDHLSERIADARASVRDLDRRLDGIQNRLVELDKELSADLERHRRLTESG